MPSLTSCLSERKKDFFLLWWRNPIAAVIRQKANTREKLSSLAAYYLWKTRNIWRFPSSVRWAQYTRMANIEYYNLFCIFFIDCFAVVPHRKCAIVRRTFPSPSYKVTRPEDKLRSPDVDDAWTLSFLSLPASHLCHQGLGWPYIIVRSFIY